VFEEARKVLDDFDAQEIDDDGEWKNGNLLS
jgi:hypothetical protein